MKFIEFYTAMFDKEMKHSSDPIRAAEVANSAVASIPYWAFEDGKAPYDKKIEEDIQEIKEKLNTLTKNKIGFTT